ncbi:hypothetical protein [Cryptosporangium arvum]|uniref:hypothetical protein n=1 Tax=Cryptosporangium arvum TaxID=80871 RepID=UPI0004ADF1A5|nr:hypothetical protein [Cryptosporangium arvum]
MGSFLLVVVAALVLSGIVFGAAAFTLGRDRGLTPPRPDGVPFDLPADRPLERVDVEGLRVDTAIRGYRMDQVDEIFQRVADDFDFLHARIIDLEDQLHGRRPEGDEDEEPPFEFPWDAEKSEESALEPGSAADLDERKTDADTAPEDADPADADSLRADSARADSDRPDSARADSDRPDSARAESAGARSAEVASDGVASGEAGPVEERSDTAEEAEIAGPRSGRGR